MNFLDKITVLILTFNEEANIERTLCSLIRFPRIIILDSGSTDATCEIARLFPNVALASRSFDSHAKQWNYGLSLCDEAVKGGDRDWVLAIDADYVLSEELVCEIAALTPNPDTQGFRIRFRYLVFGKQLRGAFYPPV